MKKILLFIFAIILCIPCFVSAETYQPEHLEKYIKTTVYYEFMNETEGFSWNVTYDASTKKMKSSYKGVGSNNDDTFIEFYLTYNEEDNSLEYIGDTNVEKNVAENIHLGFIVYSLGEMFGYSTDDVKELMSGEDITGYIYDEDGIWIDYEELKDYSISDGTKISGRLVKKLKISLAEGFGNLEEKNEPVDPDNIKVNDNSSSEGTNNDEIVDDDDYSEGSNDNENVKNPSTLDMNVYLIVISIIICSMLTLIGIKRIKKQSI